MKDHVATLTPVPATWDAAEAVALLEECRAAVAPASTLYGQPRLRQTGPAQLERQASSTLGAELAVMCKAANALAWSTNGSDWLKTGFSSAASSSACGTTGSEVRRSTTAVRAPESTTRCIPSLFLTVISPTKPPPASGRGFQYPHTTWKTDWTPRVPD